MQNNHDDTEFSTDIIAYEAAASYAIAATVGLVCASLLLLS